MTAQEDENGAATTSTTATASSHDTNNATSAEEPKNNGICRVRLEEHLNQRRVSFTPHEYSFAKHVIQKGDDSDVQVLATTLKDQDLFFVTHHEPNDTDNEDRRNEQEEKEQDNEQEESKDSLGSFVPSTTPTPSSQTPPAPSLLLFSPAGSIRRQSRIEVRRSCTTQAELWKRAAHHIAQRTKAQTLLQSPQSPQSQPQPSPVGDEDDRGGLRPRSLSVAGVPNALPATTTTATVSPPPPRMVDMVTAILSMKDDRNFPGDNEKKEDENASWILDASTDDDDDSRSGGKSRDGSSSGAGPVEPKDSSTDQPNPEEEELVASTSSSHHPPLLTRRASLNLYNGEGFEVGEEELFDINSTPHYDPWDEETDRTGHTFDFHILGTSHYDESVLPHVLSPPLMQALQESLPYSQRGESFWLKYSMVRDGASLSTLLRQVRGSTNTLLAMETIDGQVFGAYCTSPWTTQPHFYGTGDSSFVWRMNHSRMEMADSVWEQAKRETDLDMFHHSSSAAAAHLQQPAPAQSNPMMVQLCQSNRLGIGAGTPSVPITLSSTGEVYNPQDFGFAIALGESLLEVCSSACLSYDSPPLLRPTNYHHHPTDDDYDHHHHHLGGHHGGAGVPMELINLEVWALTPFLTEEEARHMEYHRLFLKRNATF